MALNFGRYLALFVVDDLSNHSDSDIDNQQHMGDLCEIPNLARSTASPERNDPVPSPATSCFSLSSKAALPWLNSPGKKESHFARSPAGSAVIENMVSLG
jgi:hypothetical protein